MISDLLLKIYDFLSSKKALTIGLLLLTACICVCLSSRLDYEEDISKFLPSDPESAKYSDIYNALGAKNNIILIFSGSDSLSHYDIEDAIDCFEEKFSEADTSGLISDRQFTVDAGNTEVLVNTVTSSWPLYMTDEDYARADSLIAIPGYADSVVLAGRRSLLLPGSEMTARSLRTDPLRIFTPVLLRLAQGAKVSGFTIEDDYLFTSEGKGLAFMTSPYGGSESGKNAVIAKMVESVSEETEKACPGIDVTAVGAPIIAAGNADRIKKDSILAISTALVLIGLLLILTFKRFSDIWLIALSIGFGWLFALGGMSLLRDSMSIIVIGVASVIIGIAVNYPLHFLDSLKSGISTRENLKEMISPLLIGNITTISAFLCLVWMKTTAMQDLGLFGSLMLAGTIIFVLIFLPVLSKKRNQTNNTFEPGRILPDKVPGSPYLFAAIMLLVGVMAYFSRGTLFDSNMQNINYMTTEQRDGLQMLASRSSGNHELYAIAEGATLEEALQANDSLQKTIGSLRQESTVSSCRGAGSFIPSVKEQEKRISRWNLFISKLKQSGIESRLTEAAVKYGFAEDVFDPFFEMLDKTFEPCQNVESSPLIAAYDGTSVLNVNDRWHIVNTLGFDSQEDETLIRQSITSCPGASSFNTSDISNRLLKILSESFDYIGAVCGLIVFIFLCLSFRRLELSLLSFLPLAASWYLILGSMHLLGISFNIVNIILATFIFGQGDDYTIFITEGLIYEYAYGKKRLSTYKNSVFNSAVIMFIGIGVLAFAKHPAMSSLGKVTVVGMFTVVMMAYYLPPVIFKYLTESHSRKRDVPVTLKRLVYSIWSICGYAIVMFLFVYPYTFLHFLIKGNGEDSKLSYHIFLSKVARFFIEHVPGVRFNIHPYDKDIFSQSSIIVCNHQSHLDLMSLMMLTPKLLFVTNEWVWKNPLYGYVLRKAGYFPITGAIDSNLEYIKEMTDKGYSIAVFPEATRSEDGSIGRFHKGAFHAAEVLGLDIVPVFLHGTGHVLPKNDFMLREGTIDMEVGTRMAPDGDYRTLAKSYRRLYIDRMEEMREKYETPEYLSKYVMYKYLYKGANIESAARKELKDIASVQFVPEEDGNYVINNCGLGCKAWICALMHPDKKVVATDSDEENILIAANCSCIPGNLVFKKQERCAEHS